MSYPLHALPKSGPARTVHTETGFWGLDVSGGALSRPIARASDTCNLIWQGDALKRRQGNILLGNYPGKIHGIYFLKEECIVHAGSALFATGADGIRRQVYSKLKDGPSMGFVRRQKVVERQCLNNEIYAWKRVEHTDDYLFINDGAGYFFYDGKELHPIIEYAWGESFRSEIYENGQPVSFYADVPISITGKLPDGSGGDAHPRGDNIISQFHCESFYVGDDQDYKSFVLDVPYFDVNRYFSAPEILLRDSEGNWRNYACISTEDYYRMPDGRMRFSIETPIRGGMNFSYDEEGRVVNLGVGVHTIANDGMDNVRIAIPVHKDYPKIVSTATVQAFYGPDGTDNVLFLGGSEPSPGLDTFSAPDNFFCFYSTSVERLGDERVPITGYCLLPDGRMAILKNDPHGANVYFRSHKVVSMGQTLSGQPYQLDAYPSKMGAAVEGCVSPRTVGICGNEPIFLADSGLYSVRSVSDELTNLNETVRRSATIDPLLNNVDEKSTCGIFWKGYYLIAGGAEGFISDGRQDGAGALRFLKWTFPAAVTALAKKEKRLYWGDCEGNLYRLAEKEEQGDEAMPCYWRFYLPVDRGGRRQILKQLASALCPDYDGVVRLRLFAEQTAMSDQILSVRRLDFSTLDFADFSFDGSNSMRWIALPIDAYSADGFEAMLFLDGGENLLLWGLRMIYEKGGIVR